MSARSLNKVMLIGNLTKDPVVRYTPSGTPVSTFGLATNREYTSSSGQQVEDTEYHNVTVWSKLAEICGKILRKGMKVYIEGRLRTYSYVDKETNKNVYRTEVVATDMFIVAFPKSMSGQSSTDLDDQTDQPSVKDGQGDNEYGDEVNFDDLGSDTEDGVDSDDKDNTDDDSKTPF